LVLSLWKLRVGAEAYYLSQVARGLDDYYSGQGEDPGRWIGNASPGLSLDSEVTGEDLRAVLAGLAPGTGLTPNGDQLRVVTRRVPGFDLTFAVPKSVSVVYALGNPRVQGLVVEAGHAAVAETLAWLEREACFVRRGTNNRSAKVASPEAWGTSRLPGAGFVAAEFRHRTSRAGDPHLHWHVLVANLTRGPDGRWSALDGTALYRSKRAAGAVFQAALRRELAVRLGVEWLPAQRDVAEIAGVPQAICRLFSKRRAEIEAELDRIGRDDPAAADAAMLATRRARPDLDPDSFDAAWKHGAAVAGWGPEQLEALLAHLRPGRRTAEPAAPIPPLSDSAQGGWDVWVRAVGARLVETGSTFTRLQITQTVAGMLPSGAPGAEVDRLTARVVAHPELVALPTDAVSVGRASGWNQRYTTRSLLAVETRLVATITAGVDARVGVLRPEAVDAVAGRFPSLGPDQHDTLTRLCGQGNGVEVLVGRAGTGKTHTLAAVAAAFEAAGWTVLGVAPSARAARELEAQAGIAGHTVPRFHRHADLHPLAAPTVVVVDEAGMCGTLDLESIVTRVRRAGAKVILVGDHHQLPEVTAGGGFAAALDTLGERACELAVNRRQHEPWERDALNQLRHGDVHAAWDAYQAHDRVTLTADPVALHQRVADDWWDAHRSGQHALLLAGTRAEAQALNRHARHRAAGAGLLTGLPLAAAGRTFQVGDRIVLLRNDAHQTTPTGEPAAVDNGTLATITRIDHERRSVTIQVHGTDRSVQLGHEYLAAGWVDHGYAMTIHKSQGTTCDAVFVVGPAGLYREAAYVALSRARHGARLFATTRQAAELAEQPHTTGIPLPNEPPADDPEHDLVAQLHRSEAQTLALSQHPDLLAIHTLAGQPLDVLEARASFVRGVEHDARRAGLIDPADADARLRRAVHAREHLAVGHQIRALDRDNVGTVIAINDTQGSALTRFVSDTGHTAHRILQWWDLAPIDHAPPVPITEPAQQSLDRLTAETADVGQDWDRALAHRGVAPGERARLDGALAVRRQQLAEQVHADQPAWLTWWIGPRPADPIGSTTWDDTITRIAAWRDRHHLDPETPGLGPRPTDHHIADAWHEEMATLLATRLWLECRTPHPDHLALPALDPAALHARIAELDGSSPPPHPTRPASSTCSSPAISPPKTSTPRSAPPTTPKPTGATGSSPTGPTSSNAPSSNASSTDTNHSPTGPPRSPPRSPTPSNASPRSSRRR
jgi:conjugative relaxase-like TrwC/TraI family protein